MNITQDLSIIELVVNASLVVKLVMALLTLTVNQAFSTTPIGLSRTSIVSFGELRKFGGSIDTSLARTGYSSVCVRDASSWLMMSVATRIQSAGYSSKSGLSVEKCGPSTCR